MTRNSERAESLDQVRGRLETEGVKAAVEALIAVCNDPKAPAPAKAAAGTSILRAAGLFERRDGGFDKELHEMTGAELEAYLQRLNRERRELTAAADQTEETPFD